MQHPWLRQWGRTLLTITGILLLIIFGTRAASQASSLAAVGGEIKKSTGSVNLAIGQLTLFSPSTTSGAIYLATSHDVSYVGSANSSQYTAASDNLKDSLHKEVKNVLNVVKSQSSNLASESVSSTATLHQPAHTKNLKLADPMATGQDVK